MLINWSWSSDAINNWKGWHGLLASWHYLLFLLPGPKATVCQGALGGKYLIGLPEFVARCSYHHTGFQQYWRQMVRHHGHQPGTQLDQQNWAKGQLRSAGSQSLKIREMKQRVQSERRGKVARGTKVRRFVFPQKKIHRYAVSGSE